MRYEVILKKRQSSDGKIASIDEYWGDDGEVPKWRLDMKIGMKIR